MKYTINPGEWAVGGTIIITISKKNIVTIQFCKYLKTEVQIEKIFNDYDISGMDEFLNSYTSSYYSSKCMDWIKRNLKDESTHV